MKPKSSGHNYRRPSPEALIHPTSFSYRKPLRLNSWRVSAKKLYNRPASKTFWISANFKTKTFQLKSTWLDVCARTFFLIKIFLPFRKNSPHVSPWKKCNRSGPWNTWIIFIFLSMWLRYQSCEICPISNSRNIVVL